MLAAAAASANMRAPYRLAFTSGGALIPVKGLTVLSEKLKFHFENFAAGNISEVTAKKHRCKVETTYKINSATAQSASFEFISPSSESVLIKINGVRTVSKSDILFNDDRNDSGSWSRDVKTSYSIKFNSDLQKGINEIEVSYIQPVSIFETKYGYFTKSEYSNSVSYEFWPIKEWNIDKNFTAEIEISAPCVWWFTDFITGPDVNIELKGFSKVYNSEIKILNGKYSHKDDILYRKCALTETYPDILEIIVNEK
jgi:hypothetical protein